jgi:23S rRNA pseudouridine2605 synthase
MIERGKPGSREGRVMTQPTKIKLIRDAENPWYEMTLTEGRNRELRKMFEEIGHHVEKIRRVGYGPLVLDVPPGEVRDLSEAEVESLRRAARPKSAKAVAARTKTLSKPGSKPPSKTAAKRPAKRPSKGAQRKSR